MNLRVADISEAEAVTHLVNAAYVVEKFFVDGDRIDVDQARAYFRTGEFLVAEDQGAFAGCVYIELRGDRGYFGLLSTDPSRQRSGLGSCLIAAAENRCREAGCRFMDIQVVNLREELPPFYRRLGYLDAGTAPFTPGVATKLPCHFLKLSKAL
jgi:GNAT superfamily N-acetyltransferase